MSGWTVYLYLYDELEGIGFVSKYLFHYNQALFILVWQHYGTNSNLLKSL